MKELGKTPDLDFHKFRFAEMGLPHDDQLHNEAMAIIRRAEEGRAEKIKRRLKGLFYKKNRIAEPMALETSDKIA